MSTRNDWRLQTSPVVVVVCDIGANLAYWAFADEAETLSGVRVSRKDVLPATADKLRRGLETRNDLRGLRALVLLAPVLDRYWTEIDERIGGDAFLPIDEEMLAGAKLLYTQLPRLRYTLALPPLALVPWDVWVAKSHLAFGDYYEIRWAVFDEIIEYLRPMVV